ncbi:MAG: hypothetical protein DRO13_01425 [Thermoprotei archaeon]|nr:MAG: hypothetical protein DRO13_01425 [Thermoprotei archaeon]
MLKNHDLHEVALNMTSWKEAFVFGVNELDQLLGRVLRPRSTIVVAGHPGAGKTTLAMTVCYHNALNGKPCLYITFQEEKNKLFNVMKDLGMDLETVERKGLLRFVKLPITLSAKEVSEYVMRLVQEFAPRILVIDSINAALESLKLSGEVRGWLQNFYYALADIVNGVIVLIAELPFGEEKLELGAIEFVADAILILKHKIENRLIVRTLEIRKARGAPISIAELPFSITEKTGLEVHVPPLTEEIGPEGRELPAPCNEIEKALNHLHLGMNIYVTYPPDARIPTYIGLLTGILLLNKLKTLVVSYIYPPDTVRSMTIGILKRIGIEYSIAENLVDKYLIFKSFNPFSMSIDTLAIREIAPLEEYPDINAVVFHGVEIIGSSIPINRYLPALYNQIYYLKSQNKLVIRMGSYVDQKLYSINSSLADLVIKIEPLDTRSGVMREKLYIWRRGRQPILLGYDDLLRCLDEIKVKLKKMVER